jgi:nitroreductase
MTTMPKTPVTEQMAQHRSVRFFDTTRPLPEGTLETLVGAAQAASTSSNMQIWSVIVVADRDKRRTLCGHCRNQAFIDEAPLFLLFCADTYRLRWLAERQGYAMNYSRIDFLLAAAIDSALACQNAALAAESLGLGTCMVGGVRNKAREVAQLFELPPGVFGTIGLAVGWPRRINNVKPRVPPSVVVHTDRYSTANFEQGIAAYDAVMAATGIYDGRRVRVPGVTPEPDEDLAHYGWAEHTGRRLQRGNAGRQAMGAFLREWGFVLD